MDAVEALTQLGGVARLRDLLRVTTRRRVRTAVAHGRIVVAGRDRYQLPGLDEALVTAARLRGSLSHLSAAAWHGWELAFPPTDPWITVPPNSRVTPPAPRHLFWAPVPRVTPPVTSPLRTVTDCSRRLAFGPALTVADSALRHGAVSAADLVADAAAVRGKGAPCARRVARHASGLSANPFESMLRSIALECGLEAVPQVAIQIAGVTVHPDVVEPARRIVAEADSWQFHTGREAHARDCWRYTMLVVDGWTVLRFTWRQVMYEPDFVRSVLLAVRQGHPSRRSERR